MILILPSLMVKLFKSFILSNSGGNEGGMYPQLSSIHLSVFRLVATFE